MVRKLLGTGRVLPLKGFLKHNVELFVAVAVATVASLSACSGGAPATTAPPQTAAPTRAANPPSAPLPAGWDSWINALSSAGYSVLQGGVYLLDEQACRLYVEYFGNCAGNNPVAPYFFIQVPVVPGQYLDPYYATDFETTTSTGVPISEFFRLADNDALVVIVSMPPRSAYFGYQSYVYTRDLSNYGDGGSRSGDGSSGSVIMPDPNRVATFGSIGNAVNNVVMQSQTGVQWNGGVLAMITSPNRTLDSALRQVMDRSTTMDSSLLISEPIGDFAYTGIGQTADEFFTMIRYALPEDLTAGESWAASPQNSIWVFRVTDHSAASVVRYPTPAYSAKTATNESLLLSPQQEFANLLANYSQAQLGYVPAVSSMATTVYYNNQNQLSGQVGLNCIAIGIPCAGDDQDTDAYRVQSLGLLTGAQTAFVVGVDHTQFPSEVSANATYISIGVYDGPTLTGVVGLSQTNLYGAGFTAGTLTGSASAMLQDLGLYEQASPRLKAELPYFYAVAVSRQCPIQKAWCIQIDDTQIPEADGVVISQRAYMRLGTTTGGNPDLMLTPLTVHPDTSTAKQ